MLHVSLTYRGRRAIGAFVEPADLELIGRLRAQGREGAVPALDARGRPIVVRVERLAADPEVLGFGADPVGEGHLRTPRAG